MKYLLMIVSLMLVGCTEQKTWYIAKKLPKFGAFDKKDGVILKPPILHLKDSKGLPSCTAFVIDNNYAITAAHCLTHTSVPDEDVVHAAVQQVIEFNLFTKSTLSKNIATDMEDKNPMEFTVAGFYTRGDLGLIKGDFSKFDHVKIIPNVALAEVLYSTTVLSCGFPLGQKTLSCIPAGALRPFGSSIIAQGEMYPGMSGGPVLEPQSGIVIGLNTGTIGNPSHPSLIVISPLTGLLGVFQIE